MRSRCFDAKSNFRKLFKNNPFCRFGCLVQEDKNHIFKNCQKIYSIHKNNSDIEYDGIFCDATIQIRTIKFFSGIEKTRLYLKEHQARTLASSIVYYWILQQTHICRGHY